MSAIMMLSTTMKPVRALWGGLVLWILVLAGFQKASASQVIVSQTVNVNQDVPDMGDLVNQFDWVNTGLTSIDSVKVRVILSSPVSTDPMWLGQLKVTLTHGLPSEPFRSQIVLDRRGVTAFNSFGDSSSSLNEEFDLGGTVFAGTWLASERWILLVSDLQAGGLARLDSYTVTVSGVPEPSSASLLVVGIGGLLALRRRRKS